MKMPFRFGRREYAVETIDEEHAEAIAAIHEEGFHRPWSAEEFETLIGQDTVSGFLAREIGRRDERPAGFVLIRVAADEAEILTIAVARAHRRCGVGWALMDAALRRLHGERMAKVFLEVDETNVAAISLYRRLGFGVVGRRPGYYETGEEKSAALVMRRDLR